jgi:Cdc6-like AAA superfamily ATPase
MTESQHSDDASFLNESIRNPIQPIGSTQAFKKNPVFYNSKINTNRSTNKFINVLYPNKSTNKLEYAEDFQDFLSQDEANSNLNIVTVIGSKQIGKSFLIDLIISKEEKSSSRALSKNGKAYINIPTYDMRGRNG